MDILTKFRCLHFAGWEWISTLSRAPACQSPEHLRNFIAKKFQGNKISEGLMRSAYAAQPLQLFAPADKHDKVKSLYLNPSYVNKIVENSS